MESHDRLPRLRQLQAGLYHEGLGAEPAGEFRCLAEKQCLTAVPRAATQNWGLAISELEGLGNYPGEFLRLRETRAPYQVPTACGPDPGLISSHQQPRCVPGLDQASATNCCVTPGSWERGKETDNQPHTVTCLTGTSDADTKSESKGVDWQSQAKDEGSTGLTGHIPTSPSTAIWLLLLAQRVQCCPEVGLSFPEPQTQAWREDLNQGPLLPYPAHPPRSRAHLPGSCSGVNFSVSRVGNQAAGSVPETRGDDSCTCSFWVCSPRCLTLKKKNQFLRAIPSASPNHFLLEPPGSSH